jgi:Na+/proline symporter
MSYTPPLIALAVIVAGALLLAPSSIECRANLIVLIFIASALPAYQMLLFWRPGPERQGNIVSSQKRTRLTQGPGHLTL